MDGWMMNSNDNCGASDLKRSKRSDDQLGHLSDGQRSVMGTEQPQALQPGINVLVVGLQVEWLGKRRMSWISKGRKINDQGRGSKQNSTEEPTS